MADLNLTALNNGQILPVLIGGTIAIELSENPTTGYQWQIEESGPGVRLVSESFNIDQPPSFGSGGTKRLVFEATEEGPSRIRLRHWQAFSGEASIEDRFEVTIDVGG